MVTLTIFLIAVSIVAVFSVQNAVPVTITFLFWNFEASLAIVIFLSVLSGVVIGAIARSFIKYRSAEKTTYDIDNRKAG